MSPTREGSFRLFRLLGIQVHLHWSWFFVAIYSVSTRVNDYTSPVWAVLEYLALFLVVLLHEFGHALACRQVGGKSDQIILWPLGGVAYINPPQRPGAQLWSIVAGPLVNVLLLPVFWGLRHVEYGLGAVDPNPDRYLFFRYLFWMDVGLLVFNLLPVYPLDGGQILRSLLWYPLGRARSLLASTVVGFVGIAGLVALAIWMRWIWTGVMAVFLLSVCWKSFQYARKLRVVERLPRRPGFACVSCRSSPPRGNFWLCPQCRQPFDPFASSSVCPHCQAVLERVTCPDCGEARSQRAWDEAVREA